jgi:superfamily II DNA or RNA helicase
MEAIDDVQFVIREPSKAYVDDMLWLPKALINVKAIKDSLEYWDVDGNIPIKRQLWDETANHLLCPREFLKAEDYSSFPFPIVDISPRTFPKISLRMKFQPKDDDQRRADHAFSKAYSGILNLACGKGKTYLALKKITELQCPALIVVHNTFLMKQWIDEAIPKLVDMGPNKVGIIQGQTFDWRHPITVAMIHTLVARVEEDRIPPEFRQWFGTVIFDEVHHISAPLFVLSAPLIRGRRYGLTATHQRADGTDFIYKFHIGRVFHADLVQKILPRIYFQITPIYVDLKDSKVHDKTGQVHLGKLRSYMGELDESNNFRAKCIKEAVDEGRKILVVSHSKNQLKILHEMFSGSGLIIQETPQNDRPEIVRKSQVTFAIASLGFEGLDDDQLDTIFILLPFGSTNSPPNDLQQVIGRVQREREGKRTPVVIIFEDVKIPILRALCNIMRRQLREWDKHVPGMPALSYQILSVR